MDRINAGDVGSLLTALTLDHEFIDTAGNRVTGRKLVGDVWKAYYRLFPDYRIHMEQVTRRGDVVLLRGRSEGTLSPAGEVELAGSRGDPPSSVELPGPAIWSAEIRGGAVARWTVYEDTELVRSELGLGTEGTLADGDS